MKAKGKSGTGRGKTAPSADTMETDGRQYHIGLARGELAKTVLLCGDPARAERTAALFDSIRMERRNREFVTFTGSFHGTPVSVMSTGIGPDNTEIAVVEIARIASPTLIRIGSCGGIQPEIKLGDLVVSTGAVRLENTTSFYVREGYPAIADPSVALALCTAADELGARFHLGLTATAPSFYAAQGRGMDDFPTRTAGLLDEMAAARVLNFEMEASVLFTLSALRGLRAGAVCAVYASRQDNRPIPTKLKSKAELDCIQAGLLAAVHLEKMEKDRRHGADGRIWLP